MPSRRRQPITLETIADDPHVQAWAELAFAYHRITRRMEQALVTDGLTLSQFEVLIRLKMDGAMSQSALAAKLLVTKGNISGLLNRMVKARLVQRKSDRSDRRAHQIVMTPHGHQVFEQSFPKHIRLIHEILSPIKSTEVKSLHSMMMQLQAGDNETPPCPTMRQKIK